MYSGFADFITHYYIICFGPPLLIHLGPNTKLVPTPLPYVVKLSREKTFARILQFCGLYTKVFSAKFGGVALFARQKQAIHESFLRKNRIFHIFAKVFSLESFPLYGIMSAPINSPFVRYKVLVLKVC